MNYAGNEKLKEDITSLNDRLYELFRDTKAMEQKYRWNSENLADRLAGQIVGQVHEELAKLVKVVNETTYLFNE